MKTRKRRGPQFAGRVGAGLCKALPAAVLLLAVAVPAGACPIIQPPDWAVVVRIEAASGGQSGAFEQVFAPGTCIEDTYEWALSGVTDLQDASGATVATLRDLVIVLDADPAVSLSFDVTAGNSLTTFTISSAVVPFDAIEDPMAYASAAVTVTDQNANGATLTGLFDGAKAYQARYNSTSVFADLVSPVTCPPDDSTTGSQRDPISGRRMISDDVSSIESQFRFTLTPYDAATGSSRFDVIVGTVIPEPASMALLALGSIGLIARKRKAGASRTPPHREDLA